MEGVEEENVRLKEDVQKKHEEMNSLREELVVAKKQQETQMVQIEELGSEVRGV